MEGVVVYFNGSLEGVRKTSVMRISWPPRPESNPRPLEYGGMTVLKHGIPTSAIQ